MEELIRINNNTYYFNFGTKVGLYLDGNNAYLIDSGKDKEIAKKIYKVLEQNNWQLKMIINTHFHADHIGGNAYLVEKTNCQVYCNKETIPYLLNSNLEAQTLWGAIPLKSHSSTFIKANSIKEENITNSCPFEIIKIPGHTLDMIAVKTKDDVLFLGDLLNTEDLINKYGFNYIYDIKETLNSIKLIENTKSKYFLLSHSGVHQDLTHLIKVNCESIINNSKLIINLLDKPTKHEDLLQKISKHFKMTFTDIQYLLVNSTLKSYLKYLNDLNVIRFEYVDNYLYIIINEGE